MKDQINVSVGTLDDQLKAKAQNRPPSRAIRPEKPIGYKTRARANWEKTQADLDYDKKIIECDEEDKTYQDKYDKWLYGEERFELMNSEYQKKERTITRGVFFDNFDKIKRKENRGVIDKANFFSVWKQYFEQLSYVPYKPSEEADNFMNLLFHYFVPNSTEIFDFRENPLYVKTLNLNDKIFPFAVHERKGNLTMGGTGIGKTEISLSLVNLLRSQNEIILNQNKEPYTISEWRSDFYTPFYIEAKEIEKLYTKKDKDKDAEARYENLVKIPDLMIDDILAEDRSFGRESISSFLQDRYSNGKIRTHLIVNFPRTNPTVEGCLNAIGERYDFRVDSRQFEMFNIVALYEQDKRIGKYL